MELIINIVDKAKKKLVGDLISRFFKKRGINISIDINEFEGKTIENGDLKVHIDGEMTISDGQLMAMIIKGIV